MTRLTTPSGATVSVSDEKAKHLLAQGYKAAEAKRAPAKKAAPSRKSAPADDE